MNNRTKIYTILPAGTRVEYDVILTYKSPTTRKNYCIYTDNTYDKNHKLRFYTAIYNPELDNPFLGEPTTKEEWTEITATIDNIFKSTKKA